MTDEIRELYKLIHEQMKAVTYNGLWTAVYELPGEMSFTLCKHERSIAAELHEYIKGDDKRKYEVHHKTVWVPTLEVSNVRILGDYRSRALASFIFKNLSKVASYYERYMRFEISSGTNSMLRREQDKFGFDYHENVAWAIYGNEGNVYVKDPWR